MLIHTHQYTQLLEKKELLFIFTHLGITSIWIFKEIPNDAIYIILSYEILDPMSKKLELPYLSKYHITFKHD